MSAPDLLAELFTAASRVKQLHLDHIRALGVAPTTIAELGRARPAFGIAEAETEASGRYQPSGGPVHVVMPVVDGGEMVDLVAWRTTRPDRWWLRTGNGWALNPDDLRELYRWGGPPPMLHSTPLDWLRAGATGSVVLDWAAPEVGRLRWHDRIDCDDGRVAKALREAMTRAVRMPIVKVSAAETAHVA